MGCTMSGLNYSTINIIVYVTSFSRGCHIGSSDVGFVDCVLMLLWVYEDFTVLSVKRGYDCYPALQLELGFSTVVKLLLSRLALSIYLS